MEAITVGGSLIAPTWVLTAAHCLSDNNGIPYTVQDGDTVASGSYNLNNMHSYPIKRFIVYPGYNNVSGNNDIGLVELKYPIENITPIDYHTSFPPPVNAPTEVAGWGTTDETTQVITDDLMKALVPIVDFSQCNNAYGGELTDNMLCAGYFESTRDSCQGDSGGPLKLDKTLVGIGSMGYGCAQDGYPGIYTNVYNYIHWIDTYVPQKIWVPITIDSIYTFVPVYMDR